MSSMSQLCIMTDKYAKGEMNSGHFEQWFFEASLKGFSESAADSALADKIEGIMAEASHAAWPESELRDELATAIRLFEPKPVLEYS